jgi:hypothetical protein
MGLTNFRLKQAISSFVAAFSALNAHGFSITEAWASVSTPGPFSNLYTDQPGEWLWATGTSQNFTYTNPTSPVGYGPIAYGNAHASTVTGANRISFDAQFVRDFESYPVNAAFASGISFVDASAASRWYDTWTVSGPARGTPVTLTLSGSIDFSLYGSLYWPRGLRAYGIQYSLSLQGGEVLILDTSQFDSQAGPQTIDWTYSLDWTVGDPLLVGAFFLASGAAGNAATAVPCSVCVGGFYFDAVNTATLDLVQVSNGGAITSESGALVRSITGDGFYYAIAPSQPIPEPGALLLAAAGLLVLRSASVARATGVTAVVR